MISILIGAVIFGYVVYILWKVPKKQANGKCVSCDVKKVCSSAQLCIEKQDAKTK